MRGPRDHGYGDSPRAKGAPTVGERVPGCKCPNCGGDAVFAIVVEVANPPAQLYRPSDPHRVVGNYVGCPACPWASAMVTSIEQLPRTEEAKP